MDLTTYLNRNIDGLFRRALSTALRDPRESAFLFRQAHRQARAAAKRRRSEQTGDTVPAFLIASVASACNLRCAGCYARADGACNTETSRLLPAARWEELFAEAAALGISFILLAGGEPLTRMDVLEAAARVPGIVFPVLTNGTLFDAAALRLFDRHRNLLPVCSIEGDAAQTDARRGAGVYHLLEQTWRAFRTRGILFGASVTVTAENHLRVTEAAFLVELRKQGCGVVFFVEYVPADADAALHPPDDAQRAACNARLRTLRAAYPDLILIAFPGDEAQTGGCLAAGRGFFHISAAGGAEPCPFAPVSDVDLHTGSLADALRSPLFRTLRENGMLALPHTGGCALFGKKERLESLAGKE